MVKAKKNSPDRVPLRVVERPNDFTGVEQLVFVDPKTLVDKRHPENWKDHPRRQIDALDAQFESGVGWAGAMLYNRRTTKTGWSTDEPGILLDGHGRQETRYVRAGKPVPVLIGDWTAEQERQILLHLDPVGAMFDRNRKAYDELMKKHRQELEEQAGQIEEQHRQTLETFNETLDAYNDAADAIGTTSFFPDVTQDDADFGEAARNTARDVIEMDETPADTSITYDLKSWEEIPPAAFGETDIFGIPWLRTDMLGDVPEHVQNWVGPETPDAEAYFYIYGCAAIEKVRTNRMIVAFYTWDHKFESLWPDPSKFTGRMLNCKIHAAIAPNFTIVFQGHQAHAIWQVYRRQWIGRYWQEAGLRVIPDLNVPIHRDAEMVRIAHAGIPKGCPCISTQLVKADWETASESVYFTNLKADLFKSLRLLKPKSLLAYCNEKLPNGFFNGIPGDIPVVRVNTWMPERQKAIRGKKEYLSTGI